MQKVVVLASGGIDSTTLLWEYAQRFGASNVTALTVSYGQRHQAELRSVDQLVQRLGCGRHHLDLSDVFRGSKSALAGEGKSGALPEESYAAQAEEKPLIATNVELRNLVFASAAASCAMQTGSGTVAIGVHASDFAYPDCSEQFVNSLSAAILAGSAGTVTLEAPLLRMTKEQVISRGLCLGVPYELTWSCYSNQDAPCGRCASCMDRERAFLAAGLPGDPARG